MRYQPAEWERAALRCREDIWSCAPEDAEIESDVQARWFGPILATAYGALRDVPTMNLIQGAAEPGAVAGRHLDEAVEWMRGWEVVECLVPVALSRPGSRLAEEWLAWHGCEQGTVVRRYVRAAERLPGPDAAGVEVEKMPPRPEEGLDCFLIATGHVPFLAGYLFVDLPCQPGWSCYLACLDGVPVACGSMRIEGGIALLCLDATQREARGRGCHSALIRRRLADAAAAGCHTALALAPDEPGTRRSAAARNLQRAGFSEAYRSVTWRAPARIPVW